MRGWKLNLSCQFAYKERSSAIPKSGNRIPHSEPYWEEDAAVWKRPKCRPNSLTHPKGIRASSRSGVQVSDLQVVVEVPRGQTSHTLSLGFVARREKPTGFLSAPLAQSLWPSDTLHHRQQLTHFCLSCKEKTSSSWPHHTLCPQDRASAPTGWPTPLWGPKDWVTLQKLSPWGQFLTAPEVVSPHSNRGFPSWSMRQVLHGHQGDSLRATEAGPSWPLRQVLHCH